ncbi:MAG: glycosyltransferase [Nitrospira sp. SB0677_bin_15]|nr:glycosyltransferase [Nitrospira sp. SB0667_bin_9]MYD31951.1 glycosyltransferase [Nitrospira sp. SB0661_bin_20]MYG40280.1 glycosyltransferase [Nitrospira sp. SB0677_bin_15]MYH02695.1 glycosyltransferase [Nitrospira sp. SB0675_bin_23]MYJ21891.1 glycosyltransferase [Nitrospira sp. SB0673_bin_12]
MSRISVVLPTYNGTTRFVERAISSILNQTFRDFEMIVVDDASTDQTLALIRTLIPSTQVTQYIARPVNGGAAVARNHGARLAHGEFLAFLDQDDYWHPTFLEDLLEAFAQHSPTVAVIHADHWRIDVTRNRTKYVSTYRPPSRRSHPHHFLCHGHLFAVEDALYRASVFHGIGGFDESLRYGEDSDLIIRLNQGYEVHHLPKALVTQCRNYGLSACSATTPPEAVLSHQQAVLRKHAALCFENPQVIGSLPFYEAMLYRSQGKHVFRLSPENRLEARQWFKKSLQCKLTGETLFWYLRSYLR